VRRLDADGKRNAYGGNWNIGQAQRREWVQRVQLENRVLVYCCRTVVRELDRITSIVKDVSRQTVKHVMGLDTSFACLGPLTFLRSVRRCSGQQILCPALRTTEESPAVSWLPKKMGGPVAVCF
jgi:hypothetical protein